MTVIFFEMSNKQKLLKVDNMTCVPIKGMGIQIKKKDYVVIAVKWFFNDNIVPFVNVLLEPSAP